MLGPVRPGLSGYDGGGLGLVFLRELLTLSTNLSLEGMSALDVLSTYKYQPFLGNRHEQLKTAAKATPVNLKTPERFESYLFLYFLAVTVHALIERQVRNSMKTANIDRT